MDVFHWFSNQNLSLFYFSGKLSVSRFFFKLPSTTLQKGIQNKSYETKGGANRCQYDSDGDLDIERYPRSDENTEVITLGKLFLNQLCIESFHNFLLADIKGH